jgi:hypothetical protein
MPTILQFRRGTTAQNDTYTGSVGELTIDTELDTLRIHDAVNPGGHTMPSLVATQTFTNKTLESPNLTGTPTISGTALSEYIADTVGAMVDSNTESGISVTYQDEDNTLDFTLTATGVSAGTYGSASLVPIITVDAQGRVTAASTTSVAGVSTFTWNSSTETLTIGTADGGSFNADISGMASETYVNTAISNLVNGADAAYDTLKEIQDAMATDAELSAAIGAITTVQNANQWSTARTITLGGDLSGSVSVNGSANVTLTATIADDSHNHTIANVDGLQAELDGKLTAGATSGNGISGSASSGTFTVTSNATNANTANTIVYRDASGNFSAGVVTATATSARYADLAEKYTSDLEYSPGTVVVFGGPYEVTESTKSHDSAVAGVVSTDPAYLMNSDLKEGVAVALTGRVPCIVKGPVKKGTVLVTSDVPGAAQAIDPAKFSPGVVIGKALEDLDTSELTLIEIAIGRF